MTNWFWNAVAFDRWKSATDSNRRRAFQGWKGVHPILANPPWRQLQERAQKIQGDKKHVQGFSRRVLVGRSSIKHRIALASSELSEISGQYAVRRYPRL